jgi:hypothetical protein
MSDRAQAAWSGARGFEAERDGSRERMRTLGLTQDETAAEVSRRFRARPREEHRPAWGWQADGSEAG